MSQSKHIIYTMKFSKNKICQVLYSKIYCCYHKRLGLRTKLKKSDSVTKKGKKQIQKAKTFIKTRS